ncbi:LOW QUALITY PROTEIN: hypothetical protein PHMEG_00023993 [Phytophthora megakarya]|uniref:Uncharacterized protein n=1 Tax=Phytophthora megakarya TaxID=4795 RepID=A0A225VH96_9STRA|nr:LOW QUALITY PROTEIN: hypothetical protein PHMEG_00023993 [Phytophthora megakarya]
MVNAYISHKEACNLSSTPAMKRGEWYNVLHKQLLQLDSFARKPEPQTERKKSFQTTFYCDKCSIDERSATCVQKEDESTAIWHENFECVLTIPSTLGKRVVLRRPGKKPGVRKETRWELIREEECEADDELRLGSDGRSNATLSLIRRNAMSYVLL